MTSTSRAVVLFDGGPENESPPRPDLLAGRLARRLDPEH